MRAAALWPVLAGLLAACSAGARSGGGDLASPDLLAVDKAAGCVDRFGSALTDSYGRLDGKLVAVVRPTDTQCPTYNNDHLVLEIEMGGDVYRVVVNVISDRAGDQRVRFYEVEAPLERPYSVGWHTDVALDYVNDLEVHNADFEPLEMDPLIERLSASLTIGAPIAAFTVSSGGDSSHLVHRNRLDADGAIVIDPQGSPHYLLLAFATQSF